MCNFLSRLSATLENNSGMNGVYDYGINRRENNDRHDGIKPVSRNFLELF
jgi:hypothetical protein